MESASENIIGSKVEGRYLIEKEIGRGAFGMVYKAHDLYEPNRSVAIKILSKDLFKNKYIVEKFHQEIETLARISHPNVIPILEYGQIDNQPYIVTQYVDYVTLRSVISPGGTSLERSARIIRQAANALAAVHAAGIIHRDIKPENILLQTEVGGDERVRIVDFGIAKAMDPGETIGRLIGTPLYMSPEQFSTGSVSPAIDIYALGVVAYELVTGHLPFNPQSLENLLEMKRIGVKVKPKDLRPDLPEAAQELILQALSFDPNLRLSSAKVFGDRLYQALTNVQATSSPELETINTLKGESQSTKRFVDFSILFSSVAGATLLTSQLIYGLTDKIFAGAGSSGLRILYDLISLTLGCILGYFASVKAITHRNE